MRAVTYLYNRCIPIIYMVAYAPYLSAYLSAEDVNTQIYPSIGYTLLGKHKTGERCPDGIYSNLPQGF